VEEDEEMGKRRKNGRGKGRGRQQRKESEARERKREGSTISLNLYVEPQQDGIAARPTSIFHKEEAVCTLVV